MQHPHRLRRSGRKSLPRPLDRRGSSRPDLAQLRHAGGSRCPGSPGRPQRLFRGLLPGRGRRRLHLLCAQPRLRLPRPLRWGMDVFCPKRSDARRDQRRSRRPGALRPLPDDGYLAGGSPAFLLTFDRLRQAFAERNQQRHPRRPAHFRRRRHPDCQHHRDPGYLVRPEAPGRVRTDGHPFCPDGFRPLQPEHYLPGRGMFRGRESGPFRGRPVRSRL